MPTFDTVPIGEARANTMTGQRAALLQEYVGFIQGVPPGQAGKLAAGEGETTQAVQRRLNAAAETLGVSVEVRRTADARLLLDVRGSATRQASQGSGRVVCRQLTNHGCFCFEGIGDPCSPALWQQSPAIPLSPAGP